MHFVATFITKLQQFQYLEPTNINCSIFSFNGVKIFLYTHADKPFLLGTSENSTWHLGYAAQSRTRRRGGTDPRVNRRSRRCCRRCLVQPVGRWLLCHQTAESHGRKVNSLPTSHSLVRFISSRERERERERVLLGAREKEFFYRVGFIGSTNLQWRESAGDKATQAPG